MFLSKIYYALVNHTTRRKYWSDSKFAVWIRKIAKVPQKPFSATLEDWDKYDKFNNENYKFITWFTEEFLLYLQDIIYFPYDVYKNAYAYYDNRFISKTHYLQTGLTPGQHFDFDTRLLHGVFQSLVLFVEEEKAHMYKISHKNSKKLNKREAGLKYLNWEISLGEESKIQSETAKEVKEIYLWWKDIRPKRKDPYDVSGLSKYYKNINFTLSKKKKKGKQTLGNLYTKCNNIIQKYKDEDTKMMIRIIKIRDNLWI